MAGDFNRDHKSDVAHLYDYRGGHIALQEMLADASGDGGFGLSFLTWHGPTAGQNVHQVPATAADHRTDVPSFMNYKDANGNGGTHDDPHLTANPSGDGYFGAADTAGENAAPTWGAGSIKAMTASDYNGHGKGDIALFRQSEPEHPVGAPT